MFLHPHRVPVLLASVLIAALGVTAALADPPTVLYRLEGEYDYQEGCFGQCTCPVLLGQLEGTFALTPAGPSGGFETWTVSDVDWQVPELGIHFTGSGLFRQTSAQAFDVEQQLVLDLSIDGGPPEQYDSGVVPVEVPFPRIDALVSLYDMQCWDRVLLIEAAPSAAPIAFRFRATVTSVFDGLGVLGSSIAPGDTLRGVYVFDPATPNTAPPVGEGEAGLYHHDRPPAGVRMRVGSFMFGSTRHDPDFDIIVNNDFGFAGADEYGFVSRNNVARGLPHGAPVDRLDLDWLASTITEDPLQSADLPLTPPDLSLLGGGLLTVFGECTRCMGPAAFFRIEATLTSLRRPVRISADRDLFWWEGPGGGWAHDVVYGDLDTLRAGGSFASATEQCLADGQDGTVLAWDWTPAPGEAAWFVTRPVAEVPGSYDSYSLAQEGTRDEGINASGSSCP
jgi:hypothetical protein